MIKRADEVGFTLVEILIALLLAVLVGGGLFAVYQIGYNAFYRDSSRSEIQYMARKAMEDIIDQVMQAQPDSLVVTGVDGNKLEFTLTNGKRIEYTHGSNYWLYRKGPDAGSAQPIVEQIAVVKFSLFDQHILRVDVVAGDEANSFLLTQMIVPRSEKGG